jgi:hypothetical protein
MLSCNNLGHCITTALPGEVCDLDSYAVECDQLGLFADACRCYDSVDINSNSTCEGVVVGGTQNGCISYIETENYNRYNVASKNNSSTVLPYLLS